MLKTFLKNTGLFAPARYTYIKLVAVKNRLRNLLLPTAIILTYHRVADVTEDPHQLAVSPQNFEAQIQYLKENYCAVSLAEIIEHLRNKTLRKNMVAVTFDDGYADNLYQALPILEKYNVPATIFVTSNFVGTSGYPWDENRADETNRPMTQPELLQIVSSKMITIGGHTLSHPHIKTLSEQSKSSEISKDKEALSILCGRGVKVFAFPFGEFDAEAINITKKVGYDCACILSDTRVSNHSDPYSIPRFLVRNWDLPTFIKKMKHTFL